MRRYLPASLPLVIGLGLALLLQYGPWSNPVLTLRADLGTVLLLLGLAATLAWGCAVAVAVRRDRREAGRLACLRQEQADAHRRFLRRLDHELKNPITAIRAGLANLDEGVDGAILGSVRVQVNRLARLSADLRKLADLETQPLDGTAVDLSAVVAELTDTPREHLEATGRSLQVILPRAPWPLPKVLGDRDLLFLALHNLVDNACKFSGPQATIELRAFEDGSNVVVEVADTGPGIDPDEIPHLGEELYRGRSARGIEGSGLGLALVQAIVDRHRGTLTIRSRPGQGTVVALRLPVAR